MPDPVASIEEELAYCHRIDGDDLPSSGDGEVHATSGLLGASDLPVERPEHLASRRLTGYILQRYALIIAEADRAQLDLRIRLLALTCQPIYGGPVRRSFERRMCQDDLVQLLATGSEQVDRNGDKLWLAADWCNEDGTLHVVSLPYRLSYARRA
jgi:hypothetical protein